MDPEATYAPQSPDLSGYYSTPAQPDRVHPQHQQYRGSVSHISPFSSGEPQSPYAAAQQSPPGAAAFNHHNAAQETPYLNRQTPYMARHGVKHEADMDEEYVPSPGFHGSANKKFKTDGGANPANGRIAPGVAEGIEVKTKFPVARIKRIMQADEDVGKVAQVTPVVVSKALELFMISLVTKAAAEAKARSSKRVLSAHLKQAVQKDEQFDFLSEIVSKIADAPAANAKNEDSDEAAEGGKKRRNAPRRKKKTDDDF